MSPKTGSVCRMPIDSLPPINPAFFGSTGQTAAEQALNKWIQYFLIRASKWWWQHWDEVSWIAKTSRNCFWNDPVLHVQNGKSNRCYKPTCSWSGSISFGFVSSSTGHFALLSSLCSSYSTPTQNRESFVEKQFKSWNRFWAPIYDSCCIPHPSYQFGLQSFEETAWQRQTRGETVGLYVSSIEGMGVMLAWLGC